MYHCEEALQRWREVLVLLGY